MAELQTKVGELTAAELAIGGPKFNYQSLLF